MDGGLNSGMFFLGAWIRVARTIIARLPRSGFISKSVQYFACEHGRVAQAHLQRRLGACRTSRSELLLMGAA